MALVAELFPPEELASLPTNQLLALTMNAWNLLFKAEKKLTGTRTPWGPSIHDRKVQELVMKDLRKIHRQITKVAPPDR